MAGLPMRCLRCRLHWDAPNLIAAPPGASAELRDFRTNCPHCGGTAVLQNEGEHRMSQDGTWVSIAALLRDARASRQDYADLLRIVRVAAASRAEIDDVAKEVAEQTPFRALAEWMLTNRGSAGAAWLAVLLTLLAWLVPNPLGGRPADQTVNITINEGPSDEEIDNRVRELLRQQQRGEAPAVKHGRNEACHCGSGLKYKKCCLRR